MLNIPFSSGFRTYTYKVKGGAYIPLPRQDMRLTHILYVRGRVRYTCLPLRADSNGLAPMSLSYSTAPPPPPIPNNAKSATHGLPGSSSASAAAAAAASPGRLYRERLDTEVLDLGATLARSPRSYSAFSSPSLLSQVRMYGTPGGGSGAGEKPRALPPNVPSIGRLAESEVDGTRMVEFLLLHSASSGASNPEANNNNNNNDNRPPPSQPLPIRLEPRATRPAPAAQRDMEWAFFTGHRDGAAAAAARARGAGQSPAALMERGPVQAASIYVYRVLTSGGAPPAPNKPCKVDANPLAEPRTEIATAQYWVYESTATPLQTPPLCQMRRQ